MKKICGKNLFLLCIALFLFATATGASAAVALKGWSSEDDAQAPSDDHLGVYQYVLFGRYPQGSDGNNGFLTQPILWRVLSVSDSETEALLLSEKLLDCVKFGTNNTWETSNLRKWLNSVESSGFASGNGTSVKGFLHSDNFTDEEYGAIKLSNIKTTDENGGKIENTNDRMFALSGQEIQTNRYGFADSSWKGLPSKTRVASFTDYVPAHTSGNITISTWIYWLRSPHFEDGFAWYINANGPFVPGDVALPNTSVRPAFNLALESLFFKSDSNPSAGTAGSKDNPYFLFLSEVTPASPTVKTTTAANKTITIEFEADDYYNSAVYHTFTNVASATELAKNFSIFPDNSIMDAVVNDNEVVLTLANALDSAVTQIVAYNPGSTTDGLGFVTGATAIPLFVPTRIAKFVVATGPLLSNLKLSSGSLSPPFDSTALSYTVNVDNGVSSLTIIPTTIPAMGVAATITPSSPVTLNVGNNTISITLMLNGQTTIYTLMVNRAAAGGDGGDPEPTTINVAGVSLSKATLDLNPGESSQLFATVTPANATNKAVIWASSNLKVASVDNTGKVTALGPGTATITVTTVDGGRTASCLATVGAAVSGVTLNRTALSLRPDATFQLTVTVFPDAAANKKVAWSSSNPNFVTVDANGKVTAVAAGTAIITVTTEEGKKTATCTVTVSEAALEIDLSGLGLDDGVLEIESGETIDLRIETDPAGATFTAMGLPQGLILTPYGRLYGTVPQVGNYKVTVTATLNGETVLKIFLIEVTKKGINGRSSSGGCNAGEAGLMAMAVFCGAWMRAKNNTRSRQNSDD